MNTYLSLAEKLTNDASIEADISIRTTKTYKPKMISLPEGGIGKQNSFFNEGTIVTLVAQGNNEYLSGLVAAIKSKNQSRIQLHCEAIIERTRRDTLRAPKEGGLDDIPVIIDVLYGNTWLAKHMLIASHTQLALSAAVWSGGKLNDQAFRVLEHKQKKSRMADLEVLSILIPPRLTKIERAVLKAAPADLSDVHVSGPSISWSAAGLSLRYTPDTKTVKTDLTLTEIEKYLVPFADKDVQSYTVQQRQQQQADTKQQQQQQQHYTNDGQNHQQQQQQQKQNDGQQQQQQQEQHQNAKTQQQQDQNQQQQQADTKQQQQDNQQQHETNTAQEQEGSLWRDELNGGFKILPIDETIYSTLLSRIDFQSLDATQSVKELLRLRERLLVIGLG